MTNHTFNYHAQVKVMVTAEQAIAGLNNVNAWWAQDVEGTAQKKGDRFTVRFGKT